MRLLTINTGSSSLKAGLYDVAETERLILSARVERIGQAGSRLHIDDAQAVPLDTRRLKSYQGGIYRPSRAETGGFTVASL